MNSAINASSTNAAAAVDPKNQGEATSNNSNEDTCVVCFKNVEIYSIGECDHPVCHECSTRMRVLCQQNECPICRQVLGKVIFTYDKLPYRELEAKNRSEYYNKRYKIGFYTNDIQKRFFELLDHPCPKCNALPYRSFQGLRDHVRREHNLHYCDLCVDHLKIFTFERRCYTQAELNLHRTKGDPDNKSHRGHPLCEYCNKRFLDRDELFRHLRREHYFCHFCDDAHGCNEFYRDYEALAEHFRQDHYLCEEGKCATEQFIGAFRTEIDYKAHVASVHGKSLNKQQAKQTRTLQLEITLGPRGRGGQAESNIASMRSRGGHDQFHEEQDLEPSYAQNQNQQRPITIDSQNEQDFPSLGGSSSQPVQPLMPFPMRNRPAGLARTKENFPALGGGGSNPPTQRAAQPQAHGPPISSMLKKSSTTNKNLAQSAAANASSSNSGSSMVIHVSNRPNGGAIAKKPTTPGMDFPALPSSASSSSKAFPSLSMSGKNKKQQTLNQTQNHHHQQQQQQSKQQQQARLLEEDMLPTTANPTVGLVAAKHRTLVDDYVSVANPKTFQKIQMVQQEEAAELARKKNAAAAAPKLNSEAQFPTLGGGGSATNGPTNNWTKPGTERKQRELENRKSKVAPAPLLKTTPQTQPKQSNVTNKDSKENQQSSAKEKKPKDKKNNEATASNNQNQQNASTKSQSKLKEKNNNNENKLNSNVNMKSSPSANLPNGSVRKSEDLAAAQQLRPPPGFPKPNEAETKPPPPGFISSNVTVNSVAKSPNSLTFTTSMGESYSIVPKHNYTQPPDSPRRNQKLVEDFQSTMDSHECFNEFRLISQKFREGLYKPAAFYEHCQVALKDKFDELFPELLALLPDIGKQQQLYLVHAQRLNTMSAEERKSLPQLMVCSVCGQVVLSKDTEAHQTSHEFPSLKGGLSGKTMVTGKRK